MPSNLTTAAFVYKKVYAAGVPADIALREHPLLAALAKKGGFNGVDFNYSVQYGNPQGISGTFADAQSGESSQKGVQFAAQRKKKYGIGVIDGESMAASMGNEGAFVELVTNSFDSTLSEHGDSLGFEIYRDGNGIRGQRASISTNTVTLVVADDARNFKVGMTVGASPNADGSSARTGNTTVAAVDEDAGTVTLTSAAAITSFANSDYLFRKGDPTTCIEGLEAINPLTAPSATLFRGVDRTADVRRLSGVRVNDTAATILENAGLVAVKISQVGKRADCCYLNPIRFWQVARELNAKVEYDGGGTADYAFQYIVVHTPAGTIKVYSDPDCPTNRGRVLNMASNYIKHLMEFPHVIEDDGNPQLRSSTADSVEFRTRSMANLIQTIPGANGVFAI